MAEREVRIRFTGESGVLKGQAGELRQLFNNLMADTDDVRTAGEKWADAHRQQSERIARDMAEVESAARVLADSMGPEMVQALEQQGRSVEDQVQELKKMGLTIDDIKMSSDQLADAIRQRDAVLRQGTGEVGDGFRRVATEADNTRSVVANFTGNLASELPGVSGAFGPLNMAIGQFAEYATEGNISMKNFLTAAGGIAGAVVAFQALSAAIEAAGAKQREMDARTKDVVDSMESQIVKSYELAAASATASGDIDGLAAAQQGLSMALTRTGDDGDKLTTTLGSLGRTAGEAADTLASIQNDPVAALTALAQAQGLSAEQAKLLAEAVNSADTSVADLAYVSGAAKTPMNDLLKAISEGGPAGEKMRTVAIALEELQDQAEKTNFADMAKQFLDTTAASSDAAQDMVRLAEANAEANGKAGDSVAVWEEFNRLLGEADAATRDAVLGTRTAGDAVADLGDRAANTAPKIGDMAGALDSAREAAEAAEQAQREYTDTLRASWNTTFAQASAADNLAQSMQALGVAVDDPKTAVNEYDQAQREAVQAALAMVDANLANAEAMAAANGSALTAAERNANIAGSLDLLIMSLAEGSPVRVALEGYRSQLQGLDGTTANTAVTVDVAAAKTGVGDVKMAAEDLAETDATVTPEADTDTAEGRLADLQAKIDALPSTVSTLFVANVGGALNSLDRLITKLQAVELAAREAEREVARVAD